MNNLSRIEQETVILFNEAESTATIETHNGRLKRKLDRSRRRDRMKSPHRMGTTAQGNMPSRNDG